MTFDRQDQLKYTNAVKRVNLSLNFLSLYFNPLCVMKCLYFRPLFKYFEVLRVHSDLCPAGHLRDNFNWHNYNYNNIHEKTTQF